MTVLFDQDRTRDQNYRSPLSNIVQLLSTESFFHVTLNADVSSFMILDQYSRLNSFTPLGPGVEVARPDHLIQMLSYHSPRSLIARRYLISVQSLVVYGQHSLKLFGTRQLHFVQTFQDILLRYLTCS